jgi:arsenite-transporting ATPase
MNNDIHVFDSSIKNVLDQTTLKWIFVGGKGGVGKTTVSSSLAILLSKMKHKVLIISTDPAHNLSDAFNQKLGSSPTKISGFDNLFGCEIDPKSNTEDNGSKLNDILGYNPDSSTMTIFNDMTTSIPGIDEAMCLGYIMKIVKNLDFSCVVFDTAPTGHTLRLLNFPNLLEKGLEKMLTFKEKMGSVVSTLGGLSGGNFDQAFEKMFTSIDSLKENIEQINEQFKDNVGFYYL